MTHGYVDSHIIAQALRLRLKDETSVILSDLYLQILQHIEMHKTTLTDIIINDVNAKIIGRFSPFLMSAIGH